jgi:type VI secretion system protein ImpI
MNMTSGLQLELSIENETSLPDGGPISVTISGQRGLDIGRDQHLDWTLPDSGRHISGKHCEIRCKDGGYWLHDVSTNGTFLNGSDGRLPAPHRLRSGDRLQIGHYIIAVAVNGDDADAAPELAARPAVSSDFWRATEDAAPPLDPADRRAAADRRPVHGDFLDWSFDIVAAGGASDATATPAHSDAPHDADDDDLSWARGAPSAPAPQEPAPRVPAPRRPIWVSSEPAGLWDTSQPAGNEAEPHAIRRTAALASIHEAASPEAAADDAPRPADVAAAVSGDFVCLVARGAQVPETLFAQEAGELAEQLGALIRLVVDNVRQLLNARLQAKRLARTSSHTMIEALDNNPLKFSPTVEEALRLMFGSASNTYLGPRVALEQSFEDLKAHQLSTYTAMQQALSMLMGDLDPEAIDRDTAVEGGLAGAIRSRKAQLWDAYSTRWQAKTRGQTKGMVDLFMLHFGECYDRSETRK